jgi:peptidoglycan/xylan/chitin deacetylase (PgdA/CDA1 family)
LSSGSALPTTSVCVSRPDCFLSLDTNDYKDGNHNSFLSPDNFASYLIGAFDELYREGVAGRPKMMSIGLHARLVGRPGRIAGLRKFFEHVKKHEGVWYATREEIADHWAEVHPYKV